MYLLDLKVLEISFCVQYCSPEAWEGSQHVISDETKFDINYEKSETGSIHPAGLLGRVSGSGFSGNFIFHSPEAW